MNAAQCLLAAGADGAVALECGDARITYAQLRAAVRRAGGAWRALGLAAGSRAAIFAPDSIDWVIAYLGVIHAGGVAVGINSRLALAELGPILTDSEIGFVWCEADVAPGVAILASTLPGAPAVVAPASREGHDWSAALAAAPDVDACVRADDDPALWIGTSGTTGTPKGVIHAQRVTEEPHSFAAGVLGATADDRFYATSKLFFAYALANSLFAGLRLGATVILERERPTPERVRAAVEQFRPTILFTVPTLYGAMLQAGVAPGLAGRGIRRFVSAGEALPGGLRRAWAAATGTPPISGYGTSETLCLALYGDDDTGLLRPTPLTSVRYGEDVAADAPQRVWIRNPALALGYWRRPEAEADGFRDGWFSPGDMFLRRDGERLEFAGRTDDLLKVSGQWVSTLWIEQALAEAADGTIVQVAAVGVTAPDGLTKVAVMAVATPGCEAAARQRIEAAIERLPRYRRPSWMHWVSELPLTATGKLQRSRLREVHDAAVRETGRIA